MTGARFPLLVFCQQLLSLLEAGLQLVESLDTLTEQERGRDHHPVLLQLQVGLQSGMAFSQALAQWPGIFPPLFVAAIEASEQTGGVALALRRFVAYETQYQALRGRLIGALIYPAVLLSLGGLVVAFLLGYVVPRFSVVFVDRLPDMPYLSGLVIRLGLAIADNPLGALLMAAGVLGALVLVAWHPWLRGIATGVTWRLPWLGQRMVWFDLVRLYRSLAMLLRGGIPAVRSLRMIRPMTAQHHRTRIGRAIDSVSAGVPITTALQQQGLTTVVSERLLAAGERSGQVSDMLDRAADFMDAELDRSVDRATRLLEPLMMVVIGALIGGIVMLMYLPIFELADSVG